MKKVLIISSSPRKGGNSDILCDEFAAGAKEAGSTVEKVRIADKKIGYCTGCYVCQKTGKCAIKDDAKKVIDKMMAADVIVLASPVYFYSISAQLKALIDRTVVVYPKLTNKKFYYILTMADTNRKMFDGVLAAMRGFLACCEDSKECGMVCASGVYEKGTVKGTKFMASARKLGMKVK
ncbi:MAG: flavodoxin family protein [Kiritimatiellae bacterium]|nr:flavodoxin family protein [Kiritimatiellia bacterium]